MREALPASALPPPATMNIFLAGATGAIGLPSIRILVGRGHRVFAMTRQAERGSALWALGAIPVVVDAFDADALGLALRAIRPDAVLDHLTDLATIHQPGKLVEALGRNAELRRTGTANLVAAARSAGVASMVAQSIGWIYRAGREPHEEQDPLDVDATGTLGVTIDGVVALERAILDTPGLRGCVLRYGRIYGPRTGDDEAGRIELPLHVEAAAWAGVLALEKQAAGIFNVAEPNRYASTERIRRETGWHESLRA